MALHCRCNRIPTKGLNDVCVVFFLLLRTFFEANTFFCCPKEGAEKTKTFFLLLFLLIVNTEARNDFFILTSQQSMENCWQSVVLFWIFYGPIAVHENKKKVINKIWLLAFFLQRNNSIKVNCQEADGKYKKWKKGKSHTEKKNACREYR